MNDTHYRSIAEGRLSDELMARQGQWDEGQKCFRTKERQLQERSRAFQVLHQVLQYSTSEAFEDQKNNVEVLYPLCLVEKMKEKVGTGGIQDDPTLDEIRRRKQMATQTKDMQQKYTPSHLKDLEAQLLPFSGSYNLPVPPAQTKGRRQDDISAATASAANHVPKGYSSTLVELKRTRKAAEAEAKSISPVVTMMEMSASPELKSAITRIFANPDRAEVISKQEYDRREKVFEMERLKASRHQQLQLQEERIAVERELAQMKM